MPPSLDQLLFLRDVAPEALRAIEDEVTWYSLPSGWPLFMAGEEADALFFVRSGALAAFQPRAQGGHRLLGYIRAGEPVGEMALIAGEPHSAAVYAIRDSELLRINRSAFNRLVRAHPSLMQSLARVMLIRARQSRRRAQKAEPRVFCLIGASPTVDLRLRALALKAALARRGVRTAVLGPECEDVLAERLDQLEREHDYVVLYSPIADTGFFRSCLRQADRLWVLARANAHPSIPLFPDDLSPARAFRLVDVVMIHHGGDREAASAEAWRKAADASRILHWRDLDEADADRLARLICGQAVALVLSGGGARAYAHVGVVRALHEAGVPIDLVGGASMGAVVAACVAMGWADDEIDMRLRRAFVESNPLGDYVLPVVALARGKRVDDRLQEHFGETCIEDLAAPFFCVSANLSNARLEVHTSGKLRQALRATISLPGILPPVVAEGRGLLVDGAVLKNFPVDVMRDWHRGPIIGVDVALRGSIDPKDFIDPPNFMQWVSLRGFQSPPPIASLLMRAATLTVDPWEGRERTDLLIVPEMPDIDLRDWRRYDEAVAAGYQAAQAALERSPVPGRPSKAAVAAERAKSAAIPTIAAEEPAAEPLHTRPADE